MNKQDTKELFINPYYAINISSSLATDHDPMVSKGEWVKVNTKLIADLGPEEWLTTLLRILETGTPTSQE